MCYGLTLMSSTTRLLVLGVVRTFQPVHGYDVRRELVSWHAHEWASVKPGSIYNALKSLTQDGFLEVVGTDQIGGRPERTTYQLTAAGLKEFHVLLREEWWTVKTPTDPLMAALSFISFVPRAEAIAALEQRAAQVQSLVRNLEVSQATIDGIESPYHVREMHSLLIARVSAELAWAKRFTERLRNHEYTTGDDPPWQPQSAATTEPDEKPARGRDAKSKAKANGDGRRPTKARKAARAKSKSATAAKASESGGAWITKPRAPKKLRGS